MSADVRVRTVMRQLKLRRSRQALGWSQTRLAKELGVSLRTIQYYEAGEMPVPKVVDLAMRWLESVNSRPAMIKGRPTT